MAILTMFELQGDPEEIDARMEKAIGAEMEALAGRHGGISNTVARTEEGLIVVNLWESEEGMRSFAEQMRPKAEAAGIGPQVGWRRYEVLHHRTPE